MYICVCLYTPYTRCGACFGTTVEVVQCFMHQTQWNVRTWKNWQNMLCFGMCGRKNLQVVAKLQAKFQKPSKISLPDSFRVEMAHFDIVRWKYDSVRIFSMLRDTLELILWKKAGKKMQRFEEEHFFAKSALIGKSIFQIQRIKAVHGRYSSSGVLHDIPSNFTRSVRRRIVL